MIVAIKRFTRETEKNETIEMIKSSEVLYSLTLNIIITSFVGRAKLI